jgi:hypothetical protein
MNNPVRDVLLQCSSTSWQGIKKFVVSHFGSTAVPGLAAKPIVDMRGSSSVDRAASARTTFTWSRIRQHFVPTGLNYCSVTTCFASRRPARDYAQLKLRLAAQHFGRVDLQDDDPRNLRGCGTWSHQHQLKTVCK